LFEAYERALIGNDVAALDALFWESPLVVRYGNGENLYGIEALRAFRSARPTQDLARTLTKTVITTFGRDLATTNTEYQRLKSGLIGRQSQTWCRLPVGWRIVSAHVSFLPAPA
jgi:1-carboxybiuret hydrolase subunit AtzH-like protein